MSNRYNPARGFFIGKSGYRLAIFVVIASLAYPAAIRADALTWTAPIASETPSQSAIVRAQNAIALALEQTNSATVWLTAYASVPQETSDHPFITASGMHVRDGIVAANFLPFGTEIQIPKLFGNKMFTVEDRMNRVFSSRIDIWMPTVTSAVYFGIRHAAIIIVNHKTLAFK